MQYINKTKVMEKIKDYTFNDIILYAKGWYKGTDNICEDLGYFFSMKEDDEILRQNIGFIKKYVFLIKD